MPSGSMASGTRCRDVALRRWTGRHNPRHEPSAGVPPAANRFDLRGARAADRRGAAMNIGEIARRAGCPAAPSRTRSAASARVRGDQAAHPGGHRRAGLPAQRRRPRAQGGPHPHPRPGHPAGQPAADRHAARLRGQRRRGRRPRRPRRAAVTLGRRPRPLLRADRHRPAGGRRHPDGDPAGGRPGRPGCSRPACRSSPSAAPRTRRTCPGSTSTTPRSSPGACTTWPTSATGTSRWSTAPPNWSPPATAPATAP